MKRYGMLLTVIAVVGLLAGAGQAVEPTYTGQFGNPEEPALRPYKWMFNGVRALGHQTKDALIRGNMNTPVIGTVEGLRGVRKGTLELTESSFKGAVYAPVEKGRHLETHRLNKKVDEDLALRNIADFGSTWYFYPVLKVVDHYPLESDEKVEQRLEEAAEIREARRETAAARAYSVKDDEDDSRVRRAQERYVGDRVPMSGRNGRPPARNLLKSVR